MRKIKLIKEEKEKPKTIADISEIERKVDEIIEKNKEKLAKINAKETGEEIVEFREYETDTERRK